MPLINFTLTPLDAIQPWGQPPDLSLHWFGLSDGAYHLELGDVRLLEYRSELGLPSYVEYQVARLHEDLLAMVPRVLQPLPADVVGRLPGGSLGAAHRGLSERHADIYDRSEDVDSAMEAFRVRSLDSLYLQPGFGIWMWSFGTTVVIEWDNREELIDGREAWTASVGRYELDRSTFLSELESFDPRRIRAMNDRIESIGREGYRPEVKIDLASLRADHADRTTWLSSALKREAPEMDWQAVARGLAV